MRKSHKLALTSLSLSRFKCFAETGEVGLRPLTLVFGRNNSGKSTLLQALLLLKQTLEAPELGPRLNTRGSLYPGGSFTDLVHGHDRGSSAQFSFTLKSAEPASRIHFIFRRDADTHAPRLQELTVERHGVDALVVKRGRGKGGPYELHIGDRTLGGDRRGNFVLGEGRFLPLIGEEPPKVGKPNAHNKRARSQAREALEQLEQVLTRSRAIGAFRHAPVRRYDYEGREPAGADPTGQHVAQALIADTRKKRRPRQLVNETNKWLRALASVTLEVVPVAERIRLFELQVRHGGRGGVDNLADVGFGIGQALPVLVEGLRTPPGAAFLVQEPEIHLHPDAQLAMADFLVDLAGSGRQVIVETHSEALLLRVRRRIAEDLCLNSTDLALYVVERPGATGPSVVRSVRVDALGQTGNWPAGFLEDASAERLALLSAMAAEE